MFKGVICLLSILLLSACLPLGSGQLPVPKAINVRNLSGVDLDQVSLTADQVGRGEPRRFGMISPVLNGTTQVTERGSAPAPLPQYVVLAWVVRGGEEHQRRLDLGPVLRQAEGLAPFALIFELQPGGRVKMSVSAIP